MLRVPCGDIVAAPTTGRTSPVTTTERRDALMDARVAAVFILPRPSGRI